MTAYGQQPDVRFRIYIRLADSLGVNKPVTSYFGVHSLGFYCIDTLLTRFTDNWFEVSQNRAVYHDSVTEYSSYPPCAPTQELRIRNTSTSLCKETNGDPLGARPVNIHNFHDTLQVDTFRVSWCAGIIGDANAPKQIFSWPPPIALQQYCDSMFFLTNTGVKINMLTNSRYVYRPAEDTNASFTSARIYMYHPQKPPGPPDTIVAIKPLNGASAFPATDSLKWNPISQAFAYKVQLSTDRNFQTFVFRDSAARSFVPLSGIVVPNTWYYWRVLAFSPFGVGRYRVPADSFKTPLPPPPPPGLIFPVKGATNVTNAPRFRWFKTPYVPFGGPTYRVQVSSLASFATLLGDTTLSDTSVIFPLTFYDCDTIYWKVRATNTSGTGSDSVSFFRVTYAAPGGVTAVRPPDNALNIAARNLRLSWLGRDSCTDNYRIQITEDTTLATFTVDASAPDTFYIATTLGALKTYYWHVRAENNQLQSSYTSWKTFSTGLVPPGTPILASPPNGSTLGGTFTTLVWNSATNFPSSYKVQIDTLPSFSNPLKDSTLTDTTVNISGLLGCKTYYWHVLAKNDSGSSAYSTTFTFIVPTTKPGPPTLISPADDARNQAESTILTWAPSGTCPTAKFFVIFSDTTGAILLRDSLAGTSILVHSPGVDARYLWKVYAANSGGTSDTSSHSFRTAAITRPPAPLLSFPPNGGGNIPVTPTFIWDSTARAKTWKLEVAYDTGFTQLVLKDSTLTRPSRLVGPLLNNMVFFWRVTAKNDSGYGPKSERWNFLTLGPPIAPSPVRPSSGEQDVSPLPTFTWSMPDGATTFHLQVSRDSAFTNFIYNDSTLTQTTWTLPEWLESHKLYYWRVRGKNSAGFGPFSSKLSFRTNWIGSANWMIPLALAETGPARDTIYFGIHPTASFGIDPWIGEFELPQPTPGYFDARFIDLQSRPGLLGEGIRVNFLPFSGNYHQVDTFRVSFQPGVGSFPLTVSWPKSFIRDICDSMIIVDEFNGVSVPRKHMERDSVVSVATSTVLIIEYGAFPLGVHDKGREKEVARGFALAQNYPNPFNPSTLLQFSTESEAEVQLIVFDVLGNEVSRLVDGTYYAGVHTVTWNGRNDHGFPMPSGVYYVRMNATARSTGTGEPANFVTTRKMIMVK